MSFIAAPFAECAVEELAATSTDTIEDWLPAKILTLHIPSNSTSEFRLSRPCFPCALPIIALSLP